MPFQLTSRELHSCLENLWAAWEQTKHSQLRASRSMRGTAGTKLTVRTTQPLKKAVTEAQTMSDFRHLLPELI